MRIYKSETLTGEEGNTMIVAVGILMIIGILATSIWVKTLSGLNLSAGEQRRLAAFAVANSGLDEALFRLEQHDPSQMPTNFNFSGQGSTEDGSYAYVVARIGDEMRWDITATGISQDKIRSVKAEAYTTSRYDFGIYGKSVVDVNGNPDNLCSFDSASGGALLCGGNLQNPILGTAGQLECAGQGWQQIPMVIFPPDGQASRCGVEGENIQRAPEPYVLEEEQPPPNASSLPGCGGINAVCTLNSLAFSSLQGGTIYQVRDLTLGSQSGEALCSAGDISQENPVTIYVTGRLRFKSGVLINVKNEGNSEGCTGRPFVGPVIAGFGPTTEPGGLRIIRTCPSNPQGIEVGSGDNFPRASMVLDATCSTVTANGGPHFYLFGAALLDQYTDNGALRVLAYDRQLSQITTRKFRVRYWHEIPPVLLNSTDEAFS